MIWYAVSSTGALVGLVLYSVTSDGTLVPLTFHAE